MIKQLQIASKYIDARETLQRLQGDRYDGNAEQFRDLIRRLAEEDQCSFIEASHKVVRDFSNEPNGEYAIMWVLAATLDLIESQPQDIQEASNG